MSSSGMPPPSFAAPSASFSGPSQQAGRGAQTNAMCVASLILGIVSVPLFWLWIPQVLSIVLGVICLKRCKQDPTQRGRWMAVVGIIAVPVSWVVVVILALRAMGFQG